MIVSHVKENRKLLKMSKLSKYVCNTAWDFYKNFFSQYIVYFLNIRVNKTKTTSNTITQTKHTH